MREWRQAGEYVDPEARKVYLWQLQQLTEVYKQKRRAQLQAEGVDKPAPQVAKMKTATMGASTRL
jgi:hypothetical protein